MEPDRSHAKRVRLVILVVIVFVIAVAWVAFGTVAHNDADNRRRTVEQQITERFRGIDVAALSAAYRAAAVGGQPPLDLPGLPQIDAATVQGVSFTPGGTRIDVTYRTDAGLGGASCIFVSAEGSPASVTIRDGDC